MAKTNPNRLKLTMEAHEVIGRIRELQGMVYALKGYGFGGAELEVEISKCDDRLGVLREELR